MSDTPRLSQSTAHALLSESPYHAWRYHPQLGAIGRERTREMDRGTILHELVWRAGSDVPGIAVLKFDNFRTKLAQQARDEALEAGLMPVLDKQMDGYQTAARSIRAAIANFDISLIGEPEHEIAWTERADDGTEVLCRGRLDMWQPQSATILDLKTCKSCRPDKCIRSMVGFGADIQRAAYVSGIEKNFPEFAGRVDFINLFATCEEPYLVTPIRHSGAMRQLGDSRWRRAINLWAKCLRNDSWPAYTTEILTLSPPQWEIAREQEAACNEEMEREA
jgi:hypothetical protein